MCCGLSQLDKIAEHSDAQDWPGLEIVPDLPGRGRGIKATRSFQPTEVVCDYNGELLPAKEGKQRYEATGENEMGFMFTFKHKSSTYWFDATEEVPGYGRLINHSRCHANVSTSSIVIKLYSSLVLYTQLHDG